MHCEGIRERFREMRKEMMLLLLLLTSRKQCYVVMIDLSIERTTVLFDIALNECGGC